jgi:hypothetical protein
LNQFEEKKVLSGNLICYLHFLSFDIIFVKLIKLFSSCVIIPLQQKNVVAEKKKDVFLLPLINYRYVKHVLGRINSKDA